MAGTPVKSCMSTRRQERRDLLCPDHFRGPACEGFDVGLCHGRAVFVTEEVLEEHLEGEGKAADVRDRIERVEPDDLERRRSNLKPGTSPEAVGGMTSPQLAIRSTRSTRRLA